MCYVYITLSFTYRLSYELYSTATVRGICIRFIHCHMIDVIVHHYNHIHNIIS